MLLFYVILALLAARPLISEQYERLDLDFLESAGAPESPPPATTAVLDSILLVASSAALWLSGRWRHVGTVGVLAAGLLAAAVLVSSVAANDGRLALLAGSSLLTAAVAGVALWALATQPWMRSLALAALLATGAVTAIKSIRQCTDEWYSTRDFWEKEYKPTLLKQGYREDDRLIINFERRLLAREAHGFAGHPNINASVLAMSGAMAAGVTFAAAAAGLPAPLIVGGALLAAAGVAGWFTGSLGAAVAAAAGLLALVVFGVWGRRLAARPAVVLLILWVGYFGGLGAVAGHGLAHGTLPHPSLEFRWHYWTAAARVFAESPLTGIGRLNFGTAYLRFKPAESTEEVRDPHNLWVSLLVELGPLGFAAGLLVFTLLSAAALRRLASLATIPPAAAVSGGDVQSALWRQVALLGIGVTLIHAAASATPFAVPGMLLTWLFDVPIPWVIVAAFVAWALAAIEKSGQTERWLAAGTLSGLIVTLVHGTLDFALLTPAGLAIFTMLATLAPPPCRGEIEPARSRWRRALGWALPALVALQILGATVPAIAAQHYASLIERDRANPTQWSISHLVSAARLGDTATRRQAVRALLAIGKDHARPSSERSAILSAAESAASNLVQEQPRSSNNRIMLAEIRGARGALMNDELNQPAAMELRATAAGDWDEAVRLNPTNPRARISAGWAWIEMEGANPLAAPRAREHFIEALRIDDLRKPEEVQRLRPIERQPVEAWLRDHQP